MIWDSYLNALITELLGLDIIARFGTNGDSIEFAVSVNGIALEGLARATAGGEITDIRRRFQEAICHVYLPTFS